jgi:hypothetical protein
LSEEAKHTASLWDDRLFSSSVSVALYVLPVAFAGVGVNIISHVLLRQLTRAEGRHDAAGEPRSDAMK